MYEEMEKMERRQKLEKNLPNDIPCRLSIIKQSHKYHEYTHWVGTEKIKISCNTAVMIGDWTWDYFSENFSVGGIFLIIKNLFFNFFKFKYKNFKEVPIHLCIFHIVRSFSLVYSLMFIFVWNHVARMY